MIFSPIWLPAALLAGLFQAWRTALQRKLRGELSISGAGLVRYLYGAPVAAALTAGYFVATGLQIPSLVPSFIWLAATAGLAQVLATALLIMSFDLRGFVVGTAFSKTEALQAAIFSLVILGERLAPLAWLGILIGVIGVLVLAFDGKDAHLKVLISGLGQRPALYGTAAGALFALTGVLVKKATGYLSIDDSVAAALLTLSVVMMFQTVMHGSYLVWSDPAMLRKVFAAWRSATQVGLLSALGSACWFIGFANAPVALVRIVGQVEVFFTIGFAHYYLRERVRPHEIVGLLLVGLAVVFALAGSHL